MTSRIPTTPAHYDQARFIERPDGFYWQSLEGGREFGPFATLPEAIDDMEYAGGDDQVGESVAEAESEIGIADWIDPDTSAPAEDSIPRLDER